MIPDGPDGPGHRWTRRAEVEVSAGSRGVCAEKPVHVGGLPAAGAPLARLHPEVSQ